ncbi:hypothetical protein MBLNU459_g5897t2 [Dothideomycetes sp. NU459]
MADSHQSPTDEATMSPIERQISLEKHLQQRPDVKELKDRHILLDTNAAPALQAQQLELQRQRATDSLKKGLAARPEKEELIGRNILPDSTAAPALQSQQRELASAMRRDSIEKHLQTRPRPDDLIKEGILSRECASQLIGTQTLTSAAKDDPLAES